MKVFRRGCLKGTPYVRCKMKCCKCEVGMLRLRKLQS